MIAEADNCTYTENLRLNELEYRQRKFHLQSMPRMIGVVLGTTCNIKCGHCYQRKNGETLLHPQSIAAELRRELREFYPYISTLRLIGGEVFAMPGFAELLADVSASSNRPIVSVCTNGTLIDEAWAKRIVRMPFITLTVSIDGGTPATYARMRQGADLNKVMANIDRVQAWKARLGSQMPYIDSFYVVMRSTFREIPEYLELMRSHGLIEVTFETLQLNDQNTTRNPELMASELIQDPAEIAELHSVLAEALGRERANFRNIRFSGLTQLFEEHGLDARFLAERSNGLYPNCDQLADAGGGFELCPNPWTTLFLTETGGVHLCFLSESSGNWFQTPLREIWNCPDAVEKRRLMTTGRYVASGCAEDTCGWRNDTTSHGAGGETGAAPAEQCAIPESTAPREVGSDLPAVRRMLTHNRERMEALELHLERAELNRQALEAEYFTYRARPLVRIANRIYRTLDALSSRFR